MSTEGNLRILCAVSIFLLVGCVARAPFAQAPVKVGDAAADLPPHLRPGSNRMLGQGPENAEPWTGTDHRFGVARAEVEALSLQKNSLKELQEYYRRVAAVAQEKPGDALAQYHWALAIYIFVRISPRIIDEKAPAEPDEASRYELQAASDLALRNCPSPKEYEFSRLRFLISVLYMRETSLVPLGRRLLRRAPRDLVVMRTMLLIHPFETEADQKTVLRYSDMIVASDPQNPFFAAVSGYTHMGVYLRNGSRENLEKAIAGYRRFLALAPPKDEFRPAAESYAEDLEKDLKEMPAAP